jgi:predicted peptidase
MVAMALVAWVLVAPLEGAPAQGTFVAKTLTQHGKTWRYSVYLPAGYQPGQEWPVILALHGAGSRGTDGLKPREQSVAVAARVYPERYPAVLVLPQCPPGRRWSGAVADHALEALERTVVEYGGDLTRLYLVGQSLGARGAVHLAARHPGRFAAVIAVAGRHPDRDEDVKRLKDLPLWHGDADESVPVTESRALVETLKSVGHPGVRYTELPGRGHDLFEEVYLDAELSRWLFGQRRGTPEG